MAAPTMALWNRHHPDMAVDLTAKSKKSKKSKVAKSAGIGGQSEAILLAIESLTAGDSPSAPSRHPVTGRFITPAEKAIPRPPVRTSSTLRRTL